MKKEIIEQFIGQLNGMIAALQQSAALGGYTTKQREACELLKDARLKLIEDLEARAVEEFLNT